MGILQVMTSLQTDYKRESLRVGLPKSNEKQEFRSQFFHTWKDIFHIVYEKKNLSDDRIVS